MHRAQMSYSTAIPSARLESGNQNKPLTDTIAFNPVCAFEDASLRDVASCRPQDT